VSEDRWFPIDIPGYGYEVFALEGAVENKTVLAGVMISVVADRANGSRMALSKQALSRFPIREAIKQLRERVGEDDWAPPTVQPGRMTRDDYKTVADIYYDAVEAGLPPHKMIARLLQTNVNTSRSWVKRARQMGLLEPSRGRGRPG
jgi:hypothetical protein